ENAQESDHLWGDGFFSFLVQAASVRNILLHQHAALAVPSRHYAQKYAQQMGLPILAMKQGVRLDTFPVRMKPGGVIRGSPLKLLLPSRFEPHQKGHDIAVDALEILGKMAIHADITFSGIREDHLLALRDFRDKIQKRGLAEQIRFTRYNAIQEAFQECDVVISPERYCSYGLSVSESLALGIPTILSDIPTYREIGLGYRHALFFKSGSAESLAQQIYRAMGSLKPVERAEAIRFRSQNDLRECAKAYGALYGAAAEKG
ncbi:MAG TPA: glycosyltransferase, partial [Allosphingosinicella sp.]|nr:glycosyltransferase [Allosphingosinicella sp.]